MADIFRVFMDIDKMAHEIDYPINKVNNTKEYNNLITAMDSTLTGKSKSDRANSRLALMGDRILDICMIDYATRVLDKTTPEIDKIRQEKFCDEYQYKVFMSMGLEKYAYNDNGFYYDDLSDDKKVSLNDKSFPYLEAIIGSAYFDAGFDATFEWVMTHILPKFDIN